MFGITLPHQISRRIAAMAKSAKLKGRFTGHSLRIGMAVDLAGAGIELPALMVAGRWESARMPAHYARGELAAKGAVARCHAENGSGS